MVHRTRGSLPTANTNVPRRITRRPFTAIHNTQTCRMNYDSLYTARSDGSPGEPKLKASKRKPLWKYQTWTSLRRISGRRRLAPQRACTGSATICLKIPDDLIANLHYCLTRIWQERGKPDWWSDSWLVAIPKKEHGIVKVGDFRPLILVDTVNKLWCKVLLLRCLPF